MSNRDLHSGITKGGHFDIGFNNTESHIPKFSCLCFASKKHFKFDVVFIIKIKMSHFRIYGRYYYISEDIRRGRGVYVDKKIGISRVNPENNNYYYYYLQKMPVTTPYLSVSVIKIITYSYMWAVKK